MDVGDFFGWGMGGMCFLESWIEFGIGGEFEEWVQDPKPPRPLSHSMVPPVAVKGPCKAQAEIAKLKRQHKQSLAIVESKLAA